MNKKIFASAILFSFALAILFSATFVAADVPQNMTLSGKLTDQKGTQLNRTLNFTFLIYNAASGNSPLWREYFDGSAHGGTQTLQNVSTTLGMWSVTLGSAIPLNLSFNESYWLELVVNNEIFAPRNPITTVPYSFSALNTSGPTNITSNSTSAFRVKTPLFDDMLVLDTRNFNFTVKAATSINNNLNVTGDAAVNSTSATAFRVRSLSFADIFVVDTSNRNITLKGVTSIHDGLNVTGPMSINATSANAFEVRSLTFDDIFLIDTSGRNITVKGLSTAIHGDLNLTGPVSINATSANAFEVRSLTFDNVFLIDTSGRNITVNGVSTAIHGDLNVTGPVTINASNGNALLVRDLTANYSQFIVNTSGAFINTTVSSVYGFKVNSPTFADIFVIDSTNRNLTVKGVSTAIHGDLNVTGPMSVNATSASAFEVRSLTFDDILLIDTSGRNITVKGVSTAIHGDLNVTGPVSINTTSATAFEVRSLAFDDIFLIDTSGRNITLKGVSTAIHGDLNITGPTSINVSSTGAFEVRSLTFDDIFLIDTTLRNFTLKGDVGFAGPVNFSSTVNISTSSDIALRIGNLTNYVLNVSTKNGEVNVSTLRTVGHQMGTTNVELHNTTGSILSTALNETSTVGFFNTSTGNLQYKRLDMYSQAGRSNIIASSLMSSTQPYAVVTLPQAYTSNESYSVSAHMVVNTSIGAQDPSIIVYGTYIEYLSASQFNVSFVAGSAFTLPILFNWIAVGY